MFQIVHARPFPPGPITFPITVRRSHFKVPSFYRRFLSHSVLHPYAFVDDFVDVLVDTLWVATLLKTAANSSFQVPRNDRFRFPSDEAL